LNTSEGPPNEVIAQIDCIRDKAQSAFVTRDADEYMRMFSRDVVYKQKNGNVLSYERLSADVLKQLRVIPSIDISRSRDSFAIVGDNAVEVVTQSTTMTASFFFIITRTIEMTRKGKYVWSRGAAGWRIVEVEILSDVVKSHWALGFLRPRRIF
jgi:hypothetical protein